MRRGKRWLYVPIFNDTQGVYVCWGDEAQIEKMLKKWGQVDSCFPEDAWDWAHGFCAIAPHSLPVICLPCCPDIRDPETLDTLAHEAVHAVNQIFRNINTDQVDEEVFAHSVGAICRAVGRLCETDS